MMQPNGKAVVLAPFWRLPSHVAVYRVERFVRWLQGEGVDVVLVRASSRDFVEQTPWGTEISMRDPVSLYREPGGPPLPAWRRRPNRLRRLAAMAVLTPDPLILWARRAARHPTVLEHAAGARWVIASSPPESVHVGAAALAARVGAKLVVDLRDGWLDEPLRSLVQTSRFHRWRERRLERRIISQAHRIFVTSEGWRQQLAQRYPGAVGKVGLLTNGYPPDGPGAVPGESAAHADERNTLELCYAGQFTQSRSTQHPRLLLEPLWLAARKGGRAACIDLVGHLSGEDVTEIAAWSPRFEEAGWSVRTHAPVPRAAILARLRRASGLLLLSASESAVPSKLFEYIPAGRPILAAASPTGALWRLCRQIPQVFLTDYLRPEHSSPVLSAFLAACAEREPAYGLPEQFTERYLRRRFLRDLELAPDDV
ncbi:MAG TPA: glycosyltransferase [Gemmatimonadales bacterium]|nr:glycosyltransferase [Gemmatimonadales bacterium]